MADGMVQATIERHLCAGPKRFSGNRVLLVETHDTCEAGRDPTARAVTPVAGWLGTMDGWRDCE